jgi:hypothetical protein
MAQKAGKIGLWSLSLSTNENPLAGALYDIWKTGQCNPSYGRIAKMIGIDRSTVIRYAKKLQNIGLLLLTCNLMKTAAQPQTSFTLPRLPKKALLHI